MNSIFDEWKDSLKELKDSIDKSLEEVRECKDAVLRVRPEFLNERREGRYIHDDSRIVLSAPEILIGDLDSDGNLRNSSAYAKIVLRGNDISLEGVSSDDSGIGQITSRASSIRQIAVDPGVDGLEDAVMGISEIINQARDISICSCADSDVFAPSALPSGGGVSICSDTTISIDAVASVENKKEGIDNAVSSLENAKKEYNSNVSEGKKTIDDLFKQIQKLIDDAGEVDKSENAISSNAAYLNDLHDEMDNLTMSLGNALNGYFRDLSFLAETCRKINAFKKLKDALPKSDEFKKNDTGASVRITGERIDLCSKDGDGNIRATDSSAVCVTTKAFLVNTDDEGELIEKSEIRLRSQNVTLSTENVKYKDKTKKTGGGEMLAAGDVNIISKNVTLSGVDSEFDQNNPLKEKALTKDGKLSVRMENVVVSSTDTEGKATGKVAVSAKDIEVKAMDVKKDDRSDDKLAQGGTLLLSAEKVFAGSKDSNNKTKELQIAADKTGVFGDTTAELQQGDGKALVQLDGGNLSVSGGKTQLFGETTVNGKTSFKADVQAPKATIDNLEAKTSFKSTNISDGIAVPAPPSSAKLSAKLKVQEKK